MATDQIELDGLVTLQTTVRGVRLVASAPDARYRRCHTDVCPHPDELRVGDAIRCVVPARYADGSGAYPAGTMLCSASTEWRIDGNRVDQFLHYYLRAVMRDGSDAHVTGTGRWDLLGGSIPSGDPELAALRVEIAELDAAWLAAHSEEISYENRRSEVQSRAAVHDESGRDPAIGRAAWTALECLECGARYAQPGNVEPGGMGCQRCA